ncbi:uroporphyrinogen-III synthase [Variovorax sp. J2P1-59]|uniref:uroporphyrinogen-III synthase n=1 Tax=Variovorax flavidus TaxID=3053501 RepID=UPI002575EF9B|nr:uroporphyrinogen-III synthase [Variovorax sp. J2P1-59]MDM0077840.1 uroporphyrinogen-III synthase [Variovorax sp. J2P1-59]
MAAARVIVTRPAREAARWVGELRAAGLDALALPLIAIEPLQDGKLLHAVRERLSDYDALMFVSAAAAEHFFTGIDASAAARSRFWGTGPGTARGLLEAGVPAASIDAPPPDAAQFDSEALWARVRPQVRPGTRVLIVRGGDASGRIGGRDWLAREITAAGGACDEVAAYRRLAPTFDEAERRLAAEGASGDSIWLFSSSEAIANLCRCMPGTQWTAARAIATHERIADAARAAGFGRVRVSSPSQVALVASIESLA